MKRKTATQQLNDALTNNFLQVSKVEVYYKTSRKTYDMKPESFLEDLQFLTESGVFADCVGWTYEKDYKTNQYIIEAGRTDSYGENIVTVYLKMNDGVSDADIHKILLVKEDD